VFSRSDTIPVKLTLFAIGLVLLFQACSQSRSAAPTPAPDAWVVGTPTPTNFPITISPPTPPTPRTGPIPQEELQPAQTVLAGLIQRDLDKIRSTYAPGMGPEAWVSLFPPEALTRQSGDLSACAGLEPTVREIQDIVRPTITFRFETNCINAPVIAAGGQSGTMQRFDTLGVRLERQGERYFTTGISTFKSFN